MENTDIVISGGGPAGLAAAAVLGSQGWRVTLVDPAPPVVEAAATGADLRSTAILQPGRDLLEQAGAWAHLAPHAMPLDRMRIIDAAGHATPRDFVSGDISERAFGWNLPNWLLRRALLERLDALDTVTFRPGIGFDSMIARRDDIQVRLSNGDRLWARLVLGCDGRNSPVRQAAGIGVRRIRYGQSAVTFAATHPIAHENVSTEIHLSGGPFTLVPLPDHDGRPCSAVVWMTDGPEAARLMALPDDQFEAEATARAISHLGPLTLVERRQCWPIIAQIADRFYADRVALAAEAAHVVPPIGAQGLNMSLADIGTLARLIATHPDDPGAPALLARYHRRRWPEVKLRELGVDMLNRTSQTARAPLQAARGVGLNLIHGVRPIRRAMMHLGLGAGR